MKFSPVFFVAVTARALLFLTAFCPLHSRAQIVINEVFINPAQDSLDPQFQSLAYCANDSFGYEWIEIYNASQCDTVSLECYILGSKTSGANEASFAFPAGTKIAPLDFITVGGPGAPNIDFNLFDFCGTAYLCGSGLWSLENTFGWVALYDQNGGVVDAVFWTQNAGQGNSLTSNMVFNNQPCVPVSCGASSLKSASQMTPGAEILYAGAAPPPGKSIFRVTDGTGGWQSGANPTPDNCNGNCAPRSDLSVQIISHLDEYCLKENGAAFAEITGGVAPYNIYWSNGVSNTDSIFNLSQGNYVVSVTDDAGCSSSDNVTLMDFGAPITVSVLPNDTAIFRGESVYLQVLSDVMLTDISWEPPTDITCTGCPDPVVSPEQTTEYMVSVMDSNGCTGNATATVRVVSDENSVFIPTAFTPDEPGLNSQLFIRSPKVVGVDFHIFDRWGKEVFSTKDQRVGWDGTDKNGVKLMAGVYVYYAVVLFENGKERTIKGNVALLR